MKPAHGSLDHLEVIILSALELCDRPYMDEEEKKEYMTAMTAAFQQLKDDDLDEIEHKWLEFKQFLNNLDINLV